MIIIVTPPFFYLIFHGLDFNLEDIERII